MMSPNKVKPSDCIDSERIAAWINNEVSLDEGKEIESHTHQCSECRDEIELCRSFHDASYLTEPEEEDLQSVRSHTEATIQDLVATTKPKKQIIHWLPAGIIGVTAAAIAFFLINSFGGSPSVIVDPARTETIRGGNLELISPMGRLETSPSSLAWKIVEEAARYRITLVDMSDRKILSVETHETTLLVGHDLLQEATRYTWSVMAINDKGGIVAQSEDAEFVVPSTRQ